MSSFNQQALYKRDRIYEQLAKPGKDYSVYSNQHYAGEILLAEYQVEQIFQDKPSGFYALGLVSVSGENPPVLVVRGFGNWGKLEDFPREFLPYNDIPDVVLTNSDEQFQAAKQIGAIAWLQDKAIKGRKADVVGQSLGGKVAQQLAVEVPEYIHCLVTFNSIGISAKDFEAYQGNVKIVHYINPADLFPYVLGEKFLPGTIFQVGNSDIKNWDLLGQHNTSVLDRPITVIQEVEIEIFYRARELYKSVKAYAKTVQNEVEELSQIAKQEVAEYEIDLNKSSQTIRQQFEISCQTVQQEFSQILQSIRQELLKSPGWKHSVQLLHQQLDDSVDLIQKELESLNRTVQQEIQGSGKNFISFSQTLKQELKESIETIKQKLNQFQLNSLPSYNSVDQTQNSGKDGRADD